MSSGYPASKDTFTNPSASDQLDSVAVPHATQHANLNDAMVAVQSTLGVNPQGGSADVATRLGTMVTSTMGTDINANGYDIYSIDQLAMGGAVLSSAGVYSAKSITVATVYTSLYLNDSVTVTTGGAFTFPSSLLLGGTFTINGAVQGLRSLQAIPTIAGSASAYPYYGFFINPTTGTVALSQFSGVYVAGGNSNVTTTRGIDLTGTLTGATVIGVDLTGTLSGTTKWALAVGNNNSYHQGALTVGGTTAGTWKLHVQGGNAATTGIGIDVSTTGPTAPGSSASGVISIYKGATNWYLLITFNDAGTTRYRYMQLNGTTATWTHGTTLPT